MSESIHLSKCRPVICNSEDDTIMEEYSQQKENYAPKVNQPQKIATILRSRSVRDREVLSESFLFSDIYMFICLLIILSLAVMCNIISMPYTK